MNYTKKFALLLVALLPALARCDTAIADNTASTTTASGACSRKTAVVRSEYGSLTRAQKLQYIAAVKCIMAKPSQLTTVPAAKSRYDDFAAVHINMTTSIHIDGIFLAWHRHFVYLMEQELHACGWPAAAGVPYWDWTRYRQLETSPMFDGSDTSLGNNGLYNPNSDTYVTPSGAVLPHGTGGGCVTKGPFANHTIYFQPLPFQTIFTGLPANWTQPAPHCLTRDLNSYGVSTFNNQSDVTYMLARKTVADFNNDINGYGNSPGIHGGGHYAIGGTGYDFFGSPQEPAFFQHHSMIDKVWNDWQCADPKNRRYVYDGTSTIFNQNSTPPVVNSTVLSFGVLGKAVTAKDVQDPLANLYCYQYI